MVANINPQPLHRATRRAVLAAVGLGAARLVLPSAAVGESSQPPTVAGGFRLLAARPVGARLRGEDGPETPVWSFAGAVPGPVLRVRHGRGLKVRLENGLPQPVGVHWHGIRTRNALDGVPSLTQVPVEPGASIDYQFEPPDAGTFWYRAHGLASARAARGLHGLLIVEESEPPDVDRDAALLLDAWRLDADGALKARAAGAGDLIVTANGARLADLAVRTNERVRLRLLNASAEVMTVRIERHSATVMAIDGQPASPFVARAGRLRLGPGNRADLFVDALLEPGASAPVVLETGHGDVPVARLSYLPDPPLRPVPRPEPAALPANSLPARMDFAHALKLALAVESIAPANSAGAAPSERGGPLFTVKRGRAVILGLRNATDLVHVVHVHGHAVRLLDNLDDGWKPFWLDTLPIEGGQTARIAFVADNPGKWQLEAAALGRDEPSAGGAWFEVT
jgi:FtsP/CotA-like multicopper oxidase with cupredoxin domain